MTYRLFFALLIALNTNYAIGQQPLNDLSLTDQKNISKIVVGGKDIATPAGVPLFSYQVNKEAFTSSKPSDKTRIEISAFDTMQSDIHARIHFINISTDTLVLQNIIPFSEKYSEALITGIGNHELSRTHLALPGRSPVNVIVPDNAWELGYNTLTIGAQLKLSGLTRRNRNTIEKAQRKRFETILYPDGSVQYDLYISTYSGSWQNGLTKVFQERKLYDTSVFSDSLFKRKDLQWIRHAYVLHLMDAWDKYYYDYTKNKYTLEGFLKRGQRLYGGDDVVAIWPTWPTLGLDQRNQFDLFQDLPGGTAAMKRMAEMSRKNNTKFFICYNPWDESTRAQNHFDGLSKLIAETSADGVVLDTKGESSKELQYAADKVRPGVVMYSEGMAVPKDMQGIVSGRVHNALTHPPMLNLNKLIKPDFSIFRVTEINKGKIIRDLAISFFNGYGTEINIMAPGEPYDIEEQYSYLGRTTRILRENTYNFTSGKYTPLIACNTDSIWVNEWNIVNKTIYTLFNLKPQGFSGPLFTVNNDSGFHFVDLWNHKLLSPELINNQFWISAEAAAFNASFLGSENEGSSGCIAKLPRLLSASVYGDQLNINANTGSEIRIWPGSPGYEKKPFKIKPGKYSVSIGKLFGRFDGDIILQLMDNGILMDETVITIAAGTPKRISVSVATRPLKKIPDKMVTIPAGKFTFKTTHGDEFIGYPKMDEDSTFTMHSFLMDKFPVTNIDFKKFMEASKYSPRDTVNFLRHWSKGTFKKGEENYPVVYISHEDAKAYATWAGKRLPTEIEWQYAAQTPDLREWPWDQQTPVTQKEEVVNSTLTVTSLEGIDSSRCNLGNGKLYPVGSYPAGISKFGLMDLVGCVWQLTNDVYETSSHRYIIMKGGSYFKPSSSWWYVQSGPRKLHYRQFLLRVSNGFERNSTVGFRCVADKLQ
ncbi:MAG TPA: SUMF1/EgtB/PvdO family nonheme iron enzyme [Chryseolinea sp.]|nr:SUMF1/EgtB/PvdO family nonheme iron enzyme [Chryseolinea sp.]